jgi:glutamine synthetase
MADKHELGTKESLGKTGKTKTDVMNLVKTEKIRLVDAVFTDPLGMWQHCTFTSNQLDDEAFDEGLPFDGSSIKLFTEINESDMIMRPDPATAWVDPFHKEKTLHIVCDIGEPGSNHGYNRDPRSIAKKVKIRKNIFRSKFF